jgi:hypothetical protein
MRLADNLVSRCHSSKHGKNNFGKSSPFAPRDFNKQRSQSESRLKEGDFKKATLFPGVFKGEVANGLSKNFKAENG